MTKPIEHQFIDWESCAFGYGYGSGEAHVIPALKAFMDLCRGELGQYDHREVESEITPTVTWLLISALCKAGIIEYGTSPRFGWLTEHGLALREFVTSKSADDLVTLVTAVDGDYVPCYPDACNCGPDGYEKGRKCANAFWQKGRP